MFGIFKPKPTHPKWYLKLYPYLFILRYDPKLFFRTITFRENWHWHYEWENIYEQQKHNTEYEYERWLHRHDESWKREHSHPREKE